MKIGLIGNNISSSNAPDIHICLANTLIFRKKIIAHNTDFTGFLKSYNFHFGKNTLGTILVLGAGGVSRAVTFALASLGIEKIFLIYKDKLKASSLSRDLSLLNINCVVTKTDRIKKIVSSFDGIINYTPVDHYDFPGYQLGNLMPNKK